jgi:DNA-binding CsgD family transcriptional regulator/tetratricopeptide (TPR) repeat protein
MELLERSPFMDALSGYAAEAGTGNGRLVLVSGESGIGKTALVETFQAQLHGARWLWGACDRLLTPRPLGPLFDIAGQAGGQFAQLCSDGASRDRLFQAFLAEIDSPDSLTAVVVEDVHWADESTIDLLRFVGRRVSRMKALVMVSYRDDEQAEDSLRMLLGDLATQRATRRLALPPLSDQAVRALVGQHDIDAAELSRVTGGNPFLVCEAIDAGWPAIPPTVRDAVGARLARATVPVRDALQAAAVIGVSGDTDLLASVVDGSQALLDDCVQTGLLTPDLGSLRFRHELLRMAVEQAIAPHRKRELHARLLAVLQDADHYDPAVLAHHAEGAGDAAAIARHALTAARRSAKLGAHREAAAQYGRALRHTDTADHQALAGLHERLAAEYLLLDRIDESEAALHAALGYRRELGEDLHIGEDLSVLSDVLCYQCRGEASSGAAEESLAIVQSLPPGPVLAQAYVGVGQSMSDAGRHAEALASIGKALEIAERLGLTDIICGALMAKGFCLIDSGQDGIGFIEQAVRVAAEAKSDQQLCSAYLGLESACVSLQRFAEAERYFSAGMVIGEQRELRCTTRCMRAERADMLLHLGKWDEAAELCTEILAIPDVAPWNQFYPLRIIGTIRARRGEPGHEELLDRSFAFVTGAGSIPWITQVRVTRAELLWLSGQPDLAWKEAQEAYSQALGRTDLWKLGSAAIWMSRLGAKPDPATALPEPYALEIAGDWPGAVLAWERLGRTYDAALTRIANSTDHRELRETLSVLDDLGARATATAARRRMKDLGMTSIPRGPRAATRAAVAGLTAREQEVLALLSQGLPDKEIARRLVISERTVHRHVSSILAKMGASTRMAAARQAVRLGVGAPT